MQGTFLVKIDRYSINIDVEDKMKILMVICIVISYGRFSYQVSLFFYSLSILNILYLNIHHNFIIIFH